MKDIAVLPGPDQLAQRRAIDWSRVTWITEAPDGTANLIFDSRIGEPPTDLRDWCGTGLPFDEAVRQWRKWKGEPGIVRAAWLCIRGKV